MKVKCEKCQSTYTVDENKLTQKVCKFKCKKCGDVIIAHITEKTPSDVSPSTIQCPSCGVTVQHSETECSTCGIIFEKFIKKLSTANNNTASENTSTQDTPQTTYLNNERTIFKKNRKGFSKIIEKFDDIALFFQVTNKTEKIIFSTLSLIWFCVEVIIIGSAINEGKLDATLTTVLFLIMHLALLGFLIVLLPFRIYKYFSQFNGLKINDLKFLSLLIILLGVGLLLYSFSLDTSVGTGYNRVNNVGLIADKQNLIIVSGIIILSGFALNMLALFRIKQTKADDTATVSGSDFSKYDRIECPECAEMIKLYAKKCRFCGHIFKDE